MTEKTLESKRGQDLVANLVRNLVNIRTGPTVLWWLALNYWELCKVTSAARVLSDRTIHGDIWRTRVDRRDLASTYVLRPLTITLSQISEYRDHRGIPEYTGEDGGD